MPALFCGIEIEVAAAIDWLVFGDNNQGGRCQAHSGSTSEELIALSGAAIGIPEPTEDGRWRRGAASLRVSHKQAGETAEKPHETPGEEGRRGGNRFAVILTCEF